MHEEFLRPDYEDVFLGGGGNDVDVDGWHYEFLQELKERVASKLLDIETEPHFASNHSYKLVAFNSKRLFSQSIVKSCQHSLDLPLIKGYRIIEVLVDINVLRLGCMLLNEVPSPRNCLEIV